MADNDIQSAVRKLDTHEENEQKDDEELDKDGDRNEAAPRAKSYREWDNDEVVEQFRQQLKAISALDERSRESILSALQGDLMGRDLDTLSKKKLIELNNHESTLVMGIVRDWQVEQGQFPQQCLPPKEYKVFNDPIHGHIVLDYPLVKIIDTPQFQRLRNIKQLGCTYYVFQGASHNRFEHSIGVCHLAGELVETLMQGQPELGITSQDVLCVKIAGLCHDLGRGPFSHVFDEMCEAGLHCDWKFEQASVRMFEYLVHDNSLVRDVLQKEGIGDNELEFIKSLILARDIPKKAFLAKVVVNKQTSIDVETMDSIARDRYHLNVLCNFDYRRLIKFVRVSEVKGEQCLCFRDKEAYDLYEMFLSRLSLSRRAYQHKTVRLIERRFAEAMKKADPVLKFSVTIKQMEDPNPQRRYEAAQRYTRLTDHVLDRIMTSEDQELEESKEILKRIERRELYKYVGVALYPPSNGEKQEEGSRNQEQLQLCESFRQTYQLSDDDILTDEVVFRFGTKSTPNPVDELPFYSKSDPNRTIPIKKDQVSQLLPEHFTEHALRVYSKNADIHHRTQVEEFFKNWVKSQKDCTWEGYTPYASPLKSHASPTLPQHLSPPSSAKRTLFT